MADLEMDCAVGLDPTRTFGPAPAPKRDRFWLGLAAAVTLIAIGSALYLGAFR